MENKKLTAVSKENFKEIDVKRRKYATRIQQGDQKIFIHHSDVIEIGCKISRLQWRPYTEKPNNHQESSVSDR